MLLPPPLSKKYFLPGIALLGALLLADPAAVADSVVTDSVGFTTTSALSNSDTFVSSPFTRPPSFVGAILSAAGNTLTVSGSPGWTPNQFVYAAGTQPNHYYVLLGPASVTNPKEGHIFTITANTASALTLDTTNDDLTGIPANAQVSVIPFWTPATIFPASDANVSFTPTTSPPAYKTLLRVPDYSAGGTNLPYSAEYYFDNGAWQRVSPAGVGNDDPLQPDGYFVVRTSNGAPTLPITNLGAVLLKKISAPLATAPSPGQDNPLGIIRPVNVSLNASGLSSIFGPGDQLLLYNNAVAAFDKAPSAIYTYDTHWRLSGDSTSADHGGDLIPQGTGFIARRVAGQSAFWTNAFPVAATGAVSRLTHSGVATSFDVNLPFGGAPGIEDRLGGANNAYLIVFTFPLPVTYTSAAVTSGTANVAGAQRSRRSTSASTVAAVNLTGVTTGQYITLTLTGVSDGTNTNDVAVRVGFLSGDTNGDGIVNAVDIAQTKSKSGQSADATNFREDLNTDGNVNSSDITFVKSRSGSGLPPP
jgi:uncharacterized protein (TIGR02597 family)